MSKVTTAALLVACLCVTTSTKSSEQRPLSEETYTLVYDKIFVRPEEDKVYLRNHEPVITVRAGGEFFPEAQITLTWRGNEVDLQSIRSKGGTLSEQLMRHQADLPSLTVDQLAARIDTERISLSSEHCPALRKHALKFHKIEITPERRSSLYAPSVTYELWFTTPLEEIHMTILAPDPTSDGTAYWGSPSRYKKLVAWIETLLEFGNERCASSKKKI